MAENHGITKNKRNK